MFTILELWKENLGITTLAICLLVYIIGTIIRANIRKKG
jgi:hypothetical protein